jgi:glutamate formiminotransferase
VKLFECVPNISEGRDRALIDACAEAIRRSGALLADRTSDALHHRSVFTFFGSAVQVRAAAVALAEVVVPSIDLRVHRGAHPRIGALDVLPFVPLGDATLDDAVAVARAAASEIWMRTGVPSVFYGAAATSAGRRLLADVRTGEFEGLLARGHRGGAPDVGEVALHPSAGAIAVGARALLVAFNLVLRDADLATARAIARDLRERSGGLGTLRALGIAIGDGRVQVSCSLTEPEATPLHRVVGLVRSAAARRGSTLESCELIGLVPRAVLRTFAEWELGLAPGALA